MKAKGKMRRFLALAVAAAVALSVNTTVFAANEGESDVTAVCTMNDGCEAKTHEEGCPLKEAELAAGGANEIC